MIGIDLFSGAGGLSLGARTAGIDVQIAIDNDRHAAITYTHNHPNTIFYNQSIKSLSIIPPKNKQNQIILFGGPPCQGFSTSNQRTRNLNNNNNTLFLEIIKFVKDIYPDWIVIENVQGISSFENGYFIEIINADLKLLGYTTDWKILNSFDFGVPQKRNRFFFIASLHNSYIPFPSPTPINVTVNDIFKDLPVLSNGNTKENIPYKSEPICAFTKQLRNGLNLCKNNLVTKNSPLIIERFKHVPPGGNWRNIPVNLLDNYKDSNRCHTGIYHRLDPTLPASVIGNYRKNMLIHPYEHRGLSVREAARLQSFPDWYEFKGSIGFQQQQVGNAVPPLLAEAIFKTILSKGI